MRILRQGLRGASGDVAGGGVLANHRSFSTHERPESIEGKTIGGAWLLYALIWKNELNELNDTPLITHFTVSSIRHKA